MAFRQFEPTASREGRGPAQTVPVAPHELGDGVSHVVLRACDDVGHGDSRFADDYGLVGGCPGGALRQA